MTEVLLLLLSLALVVACGAFVAAEFSFVTVDRASVERAAETGDGPARGVLSALRNLSTQLSGAQFGITLTTLLIGFLAEPAVARIIDGPLEAVGVPSGAVHGVAVTIALILATAVTMVLGELVPQNLAVALPLQTARAVQGFMRGFTTVNRPLIALFNNAANAVLRRIGIEPQEELASARSPEELMSLVGRSAQQGTLAPDTATLLQRSLAFGDRRADEIMTPRTRMVAMRATDPVIKVIEEARSTGFSRFPVLGTRADDVVGIVHVKHAVRIPLDGRGEVPVSEVMVPPIVVPSSLELDPLLETLREGGLQMAVVVDEFGGVDGVVTLEDVVEEIVGEVRDEHDRRDEAISREGPNRWLLSGLLRPDEVRHATGIALPESEEGDYETLAGLVSERLERVPRTGDVVELEARDDDGARRLVKLSVRRMDALRVDVLRLEVGPPIREEYEEGMSDLVALLLGVLLLALNAFFVGASFALISARRSTIEPRAREGSRRAKTVLKAMENIGLMLAGCQLGITICSLLLLAVVEPAVHGLLGAPLEAVGISDSLSHPIAFVVAFVFVGLAHVVLGEMVPKNIALAGPDRAALVLAGPLVVVVRALEPAIRLMNWIARRLLKLAGVPVRDEVASAFTRDEVAAFVSESRREGLLEPHEERLLVGALKFEERDARSVLLTTDRLQTLPVSVTPAQVEQAAASTGFSRFPVRGEEGSLIGYLHLKDALEIQDVHRNRPIARGSIRPLPRVRVNAPLRSVLATMQRSAAHMAEVVDEHDESVGVVTLEDVLEEIVGEVRDESAAGAARR